MQAQLFKIDLWGVGVFAPFELVELITNSASFFP